MRRVFLITAILALPLLAAACGGGEKAAPTAETPGPRPPAGRVSIDLWHSEPASNQETLQRMIERFNASQDEVTVRAIYQGGPTEVVTKLMAATGSRQVPAVAILMETFVQRMIDGGFVTAAQDFIDRDGTDLSDIDEQLLKYYTLEDRLWALPFCTDVPLLYYNKNAFREVGLNPDRAPADLDEVWDYSERILKRDDSGKVVRSGIALDISLWTEQVFARHGDFLLNNENGRDGRATEVLIDNETGRWFFQWWHDMVDAGLALNAGRNPSGAEAYLAVATDRAAMTFGYAGALRSLIDALEAGIENLEVGAGPAPGMPGKDEGSLLLAHGVWVFGLRPEEEQEAAWKFVKWLIAPEQQAEWFAGSGCLPVSRSAVDLPAAQDVLARYPLFQVALDAYMSGPDNPASLAALAGPMPEIREAMEQAIEQMVTGGKDPEEALKDAAENSNAVIEEYNRRVGD